MWPTMAYEHFAMTVRSVLPRDRVLGVPALLARYPGSGLPRATSYRHTPSGLWTANVSWAGVGAAPSSVVD